MTKKLFYQEPEANAITLCLEGNLLQTSVLQTIGLTSGTTTGESITYDDEYNPW